MVFDSPFLGGTTGTSSFLSAAEAARTASPSSATQERRFIGAFLVQEAGRDGTRVPQSECTAARARPQRSGRDVPFFPSHRRRAGVRRGEEDNAASRRKPQQNQQKKNQP